MADIRPLLIGQAPGPNTNPGLPLFPLPRNSAGGRLAEHMGLCRWQYMKYFERMNLLYKFDGKFVNGVDRFSIRDAKMVANSVQQLLYGREVILVGRQVANAFCVESDFFCWSVVEESGSLRRSYKVVVVPHPSGRNHWYNKGDNKNLAIKFWNTYFRERESLEILSNKV